MAILNDLLPAAKATAGSFYNHSKDSWFKERFSSSSANPTGYSPAAKSNPAPPCGKRLGFILRKPENFGDGGAFPEINVVQYPLGMGCRDQKPGSKILALTVDSEGCVAFDAVVKQDENASKIVYSQHKDFVPKIIVEEEKKSEELEKEIEKTMLRTKAALEKILHVRLSAAQPKNVPTQSYESKFIKYKPSQQSAAFNSGAKERIVRMVEMPVDPLELPKFKHKQVSKVPGSPPVPIMHSPPRPVTVEDQQDWKIPPCISNWKNPKGYTIPLDKRLAAEGRGLQDVQVNDKFASLSESLYVTEQKAREEVAMRWKVQKELMLKEKDRKEQELRALAQKARSERIAITPAPSTALPDKTLMDDSDMGIVNNDPRKETMEEREEQLQRDKIREERRRERQRRLEPRDTALGKKSKTTRDRDRDVTEKIAIGASITEAGRSGDFTYDQRLFNQEKGMESGFAADDHYNIYSKPLFTSHPTLSTLFRPKKDGGADMYGGAEGQLEKVVKTERFKPDDAFSGVRDRRSSSKRDRPVEFDKQVENDPFGLDQFFTEVKKAR